MRSPNFLPAGSGSDWRIGKVCQVCGEIACVDGWREWVAGHVGGAEFRGFVRRHEGCRTFPSGGLTMRPFRYCEICQGEVARVFDRRVGLSWICEACERYVRRSGHLLDEILHELERGRFDLDSDLRPAPPELRLEI